MPRKQENKWQRAVETYQSAQRAKADGDLARMAEQLNYLGTILTDSSPKGGRPKADFDKDEFERLCGYQCTLIEISEAMKLSEDTIERRCREVYGKGFAVVYQAKKKAGLLSLRRAQFRMAQDNPTMAIWLGKQYLNQTDKIIVTDADIDAEIERLAQLASRGETTFTSSSETEAVN